MIAPQLLARHPIPLNECISHPVPIRSLKSRLSRVERRTHTYRPFHRNRRILPLRHTRIEQRNVVIAQRQAIPEQRLVRYVLEPAQDISIHVMSKRIGNHTLPNYTEYLQLVQSCSQYLS